MYLQLPRTGLNRYKSVCQRVRVATELWGEANLYCPPCTSANLSRLQHNAVAIDYICRACQSTFQLKSQSMPFSRRIVDSAYSKMRLAILEDRTPNLYVLRYDPLEWEVRTLILIPRFAFTLSAVRTPPTTGSDGAPRRLGRLQYSLDQIAVDARIPVIDEGRILPKRGVRQAYDRLRPLDKLKIEKRGWTLDVLQTVRFLKSREKFSLSDVSAPRHTLMRLCACILRTFT